MFSVILIIGVRALRSEISSLQLPPPLTFLPRPLINLLVNPCVTRYLLSFDVCYFKGGISGGGPLQILVIEFLSLIIYFENNVWCKNRMTLTKCEFHLQNLVKISCGAWGNSVHSSMLCWLLTINYPDLNRWHIQLSLYDITVAGNT